ncbi:MAG: oligosaccharide flippase family protein [Bacteroidota bacterium]
MPLHSSPGSSEPDGRDPLRLGAEAGEDRPAQPSPEPVEEELKISQVKGRAVRATGALMSRQVVVRGINLVGFTVLAWLLEPAVFGLFAVVKFVVYFLQRFSDFGLSATLLRKKDAVTEMELRTVFTIQQCIVAVSCAILWFGTDLVVAIYPKLTTDHVWLIRVLTFSLILASLKTMPKVLIQRALRHDKLAVIDVVEVIAYYGIAVGMAFLGFEVWALIWAVLARGVIGTVWVMAIAWWRPRFGFDRAAAKEVLSFGVPIQLASLASLASEAVVPLLVFGLFGGAAVGFVNWARTMMASAVGQPLILMGKVQMRVFGRIQDQRAKLTRAVERNISLGALLVFFTATLLVAQGEAFVRLVVGEKWLPALPVLYLLAPAFLFRVVGNSYQQALKALGEGVTMFVNSLIMFVGQAAGIWLLAGHVTGPFWEGVFASPVGFVSFAIATIVAQLAVVGHAAHRLRRYIRPRWVPPLVAPLVAAVASGAAMWVLLDLWMSVWMMGLAAVAGFAVYVLVLGLLAGERLSKDVSDVLNAFGKKNARIRRLATLSERVLTGLQIGSRRPAEVGG